MATSTLQKELGDGTVKHRKPFIVFSDFDGTITLQDSNDYMTDNVGFGKDRRVFLNQEVLHDRMTFRDSFEEMLESVKLPFDECVQLLLDNVQLDPGFKVFFEWCRSHDIPVVVLSSGMKPVIRALLTKLVGEQASEIDIVSNEVDIDEVTKEWKIQFHDDSHFGHDKSLAIRPYAQLPEGERPKMVYCGDGVSDLSAARETDLLFAKRGRDLVTYCVREGMPFTQFDSFADIHKTCQAIHSGQLTFDQVAKQSAEAFAAEQA